MTDDATHGPGMHQHMLLCCGMMTLILGTLGISSVAAAVGLTTGQTYLTVAGFINLSKCRIGSTLPKADAREVTPKFT